MTIEQRQHLLAYLGYYVGKIDGKWGTLSKTACKAFQKDFGIAVDGNAGPETQKALKHAVAYGMPARKDESADEGFWKDIKHFTRNEFKCKCGGKYCNGFPVEPTANLVRTGDKIRDHFKASCKVSSGVRCEKHNSAVGGVANSNHKLGKAMDFRIEGKKSKEVLTYVDTLPEVTYAYAIDDTYVHITVK